MRTRSLIRIALFVLCCLLSARASAEPASDPLSGRLMSDTDTLCFSRIYPASNLARHPGQATTGVVLSFRRDAIRIMLRQKRVEQPSYVVATCEWSADASVDYEGKPIFPGFKQGAAFACIVMITPQSAEEGGTALIDPAPDARSLTLYLDSPVSAQRGLDRDDDLFDLKLGRQDRVFKLTRTHPDACKAMDKVLKHP